VVKKMAEVGESVAPIPPGVNLSTSSGAVVALADLDTLETEADVAESNVARLGPNQPAEVTVEAFPDKKYRAVLRQIIPTADRTKATVQVKVTLLEKDAQLRPEMSAKVQFLEPAKVESAQPSAVATSAATNRWSDARASGRFRAVVNTVAPAWRNRAATAAPIPWVPPVISARQPASSPVSLPVVMRGLRLGRCDRPHLLLCCGNGKNPQESRVLTYR